MQNQQLSDVKGKELVAAGHALASAIGMDTPLIEIAKMMAELATRLDCALVRGDELQVQRDALAAENASLKESRDILAKNSLETCNEVYCAGYRNTALHDGLMESTGNRNAYPNPIRAMVDEAIKQLSTPATDAYLNSVRAEGVRLFAAAVQGGCAVGDRVKDLADTFTAQLRAVKDGE